ncbi:MAG: hypothetical protein EP346_09245 [Bacteroidetes bacterium]|uniref:Uncharacterized protein n=1 Tax=Phaeocystidibacter marisrubri TaxID=1577780 RepID=A0A6L3ZIQ3_9FLAO|nr:hypothetical protein [Phaeocystidibacter marisrubri]KAB2817784.1 hypothetical protein F8C82_05105 [Phaeocystidibacter marisrubri]TNE28434.1 MAG: hypothetical protein EP346_09245 [Bacteroidota bacterium]
MSRINSWISDASVDWEDPTLCSEEALLKLRAPVLCEFCVESCIQLPEELRGPFLDFLDLLELESWTYKDVFHFRVVVLRILQLLESIYQNGYSSGVDLASWYMIAAFADSWNDKMQDVIQLWKGKRSFLMN